MRSSLSQDRQVGECQKSAVRAHDSATKLFSHKLPAAEPSFEQKGRGEAEEDLQANHGVIVTAKEAADSRRQETNEAGGQPGSEKIPTLHGEIESDQRQRAKCDHYFCQGLPGCSA